MSSEVCNDDNNNESLVFESQEEDEEEQTVKQSVPAATRNEPKPKPKREKFVWRDHSKWECLDELTDFLDTEEFVVYDDRDLKIGQKFYFRCSRIPEDRKRSEWCSCRFNIFLPSHSNDIILETNGEAHDHNELLKGKKRTLSIEMQTFIYDLYKKETKKHSTVLLHIDAARKEHNLFNNEPNPTNR